MRLRRTIYLLIVTLLFSFSVVVQKQAVEYGDPGELRGVSKVFVNTGTDIELRNRTVEGNT